MLITRGAVRPGETVIVSAAGSGVGHAAIQIAKLAGATVITTAGSDEKLARSREDGADHVVNYGTESVTERVLELTEGQGADLVIEHIGGEQLGQCLNALDIIPVFRNEWSVIGLRGGTVSETRLVLDLIAEGKLCPRVHAVLPLAEAAEGHRILESREHFGKVLLHP